MISSHITNKEVSKQKILYPMRYMVMRMSIGYDIHNKFNNHNLYILLIIFVRHIQS